GSNPAGRMDQFDRSAKQASLPDHGLLVRRLPIAIRLNLRAAFKPAWAGTWTLGFLHTVGIWVGMGGWEGLTQPWPLPQNDHPLHFHGAVMARRFFALTWTNAGYDPSFMSGYAASAIAYTSTALPAVLVALFGSRDPAFVYKLYVFLGV